ncbi:Holliday junction resolvase RuvX [Mycoplasma sp. Ms02]|uniref:Holliday junction resolvase RuvX n=1 Tax=Mycoplasma sp. Ms02 TaxID=353851 RepID=UPI001C89C680|nr:Holliday junction resolvase RuvX [Mycoplasma sp. Ms02]QZE12473.1 Holliday junction resolvase RuvX [Mycoplasma sp. Ms02]
MSRVLGLDLGTRTCGFAISDSDLIIASGLENFRFFEKNFQDVYQKTLDYLQEYKNITSIVIGHPLRMNGTKSQRTVMVEEFKQNLENFLSSNGFELEYHFYNEQLSTKRAESVLISANLTRQKRKEFKDKLAAVIILQDYLDDYREATKQKQELEVDWSNTDFEDIDLSNVLADFKEV